MHYYKRNLGDYAKKAGRLTMLQHGSYTLLIDACYDREQFPTLDEAIDWTWASSSAETEAVEFVLRKFFMLEDGRYVQKRIQEEIAEYREKATTNARIAQEREAKRKELFTAGARVVHESCTDRHLTNNQEPVNQEPRKKQIHPPNPPASPGGNPDSLVAQKTIAEDSADGPGTESEKPAKAKPASGKKTFGAWVDEVRAAGKKAISEYRPVWEYAERAKLPGYFVELAWLRFKEYHLDDARGKRKLQADWQQTFRNYVENNFLHLWFWSERDQAFVLTTSGVQAEKSAEALS